MICCKSTDELKIKVQVETLKSTEPNTETRTSDSAMESAGCQKGQHQEASVASNTSDSMHYPGTEDLQKKVLCLIAMNYLETTPPQCRDDRDDFKAYLKEMQVIMTGFRTGSLVMTVKCVSLQILEEFWEDYLSGHLGEVVQKCFVTEDFLKELNLTELKLKTTIEEEEYNSCKFYFEKNALRG